MSPLRFFLKSCCFTLILLSACSDKSSREVDVQDLRSYPKFETVLEHFDANYSTPTNTQLDFAKKPEGYFLRELNMVNKTEKLHPFWLRESKQFQPLPKEFSKTNETNNKLKPQLFSRNYNFDHSLYCNYPNAAKDVIDELENASNLNDTLLEALARAYNLKGDDYIGKRHSYSFEPMKSQEAMSKENASKFAENGNKLITTLERLQKLNPHYQTLVGKVSQKLANDNMYLWYELMTSGHEQLAKPFLKKNLYDDLMINYAKNALSSCEQNAILFTSGDNDTYPLWYVQNKLNFRTDVEVINSSLANIPMYNDFHCKRGNIVTTLNANDYRDSVLAFILIRNGDNNRLPIMDSLFYHIKNRNTSPYAMNYGNNKHLQFPYRGLSIASNNYEYGSYLELYFNKPYLFLSDLFQLDVIYSNTNRPIYFSYPGGSDMSMTFMNYIENRGLVNRLNPGGNPVPYNFYYPYFQKNILIKLFLEDYHYEAKFDKGYSVNSIAMSYVYQLVTIAGQLKNQADLSSAILFLEKAKKEFEIDKMENNEKVLLYAGTVAFECDAVELGKSFWNSILTNFEKHPANQLSENEKKQRLEVLFRMASLQEKINDKDYVTRIVNLMKNASASDK